MLQNTHKRQDRLFALPALALFALLLGCILSLTAAGGGAYRALTRSAEADRQSRAVTGYLSARVRAADEAGAVSVADGPEGPMLVLAEPLAESGYETRIYLYKGSLVEDYAPAGSAPAPEGAQVLADCEVFDVSIQDNIVTAATSAGTVQVYLHSGEAAK